MTLETPQPDAARANTFPWPPVLLVGAIASAIALGQFAPVAWPGTDDAPARVIGLGFGAIGVALIVSAVVALRTQNTTVMPDGVATALVTNGPYRWFRNPIYLGEALLMLAVAEVTKNIWFAGAAPVFVMLVTQLQILPEERHLQARFGEAYTTYKSFSRRWL